MIDFLSDLKTVGLTALFNPTFLFLLIVLFLLGKLIGWLTRNINIWKVLTLAYFGVFLFRPLQDAGLIIGGVFILGVASNYMDYFRNILGWAGNLGDVVSAFRYRSTFQDVSRLEREIDELKRQLHAAQAGNGTAGQSNQQSNWRQQSQARKAKQTRDGQGRSSGSSSDGGSGHGSQSRSDGQRARSQGSGASPRGRSKTGAGQKEKRGARSGKGAGKGTGTRAQASKRGASFQSRSRVKGGSGNTGSGGAKASQSRASSGKTGSSGTKRKYSGAKPNQKQSTGQNTSGAQSQQRSSQQSSQTGSQSQGAQQAASGSATNSLRDRHLQTLELSSGQTYSQKEIKAAWRKMAFKTHPDRGGSAAAFAQALAAYRALV